MTTLGRAYIEIVADGSNFASSLRDQVDKSLSKELTAASKKAGRQAGEAGGKEFTTGFAKGVTDNADAMTDRLTKALRRPAKAAGRSAGEDGGKELVRGIIIGVEANAPLIEDRMRRALARPTKAAARGAGQDSGAELVKGLARGVEAEAAGIGDRLARALSRPAKVAGRSAGKAGGESLVSEMARAIRDGMPDIDAALRIAVPRVTVAGTHLGEGAGHGFSAGLGSRVRRDAPALTGGISGFLRSVVRMFGRYGDEAGGNFFKTLRKQISVIEGKVSSILGPPLRALGNTVMGVAKAGELAGLSFAFWGTTIAALLPQILSLGAALAQLSGLLLGLPSALGPLALAFTGIYLAVTGFGAAIKATDDKQFAKAVANMGANSRKFAGELRNLKPQLEAIRDASRNAFAGELLGVFPRAVAQLSGPLKQGLADIGKSFGDLTVAVLKFLESASGLRLLREWFDSARGGLDSLGGNLPRLTKGFSDLNHVIKPLMDRIINGVGVAAGRFGDWLTKISATGQAAKWFTGALNVLKELGAIVRNLATIFGQLFKASGQSATSFLHILTLLTGGLSAFFDSAEGSAALTNFFKGIGQITKALEPALRALGTALGNIIPLFAQMIVALAPGLAALITALGQAIVALGPALVPVAQVISDLVIALAPQLPILADAFAKLVLAILPLVPALTPLVIILSETLVDAITWLTPHIGALVQKFKPWLESLAGHKDTIEKLVIGYLAFKGGLVVLSGLASTIKLGNLVGEFGGLRDVLKDVAGFGKSLVDDKTFPKLGKAIEGFGLVLNPVVTMVKALGDGLWYLATTAIPKVIPALGELAGAMVGLDITMDANPVGVVALGILALIAIIAGLVIGVKELIDHWDQVKAFFKNLPHVISEAWTAVVNFFKGLPGQITDAFHSVTDFFSDLPGTIKEKIANLPDELQPILDKVVQAFADLPQKVVDKLLVVTEDIKNWLVALPGEIADDAGKATDAIVGFLDKLPDKLKPKIEAWTRAIEAWVSELPDKINPWLDKVTQAFNTWVDNVDWGEVGKKIAEGIIIGLFVLIPKVADILVQIEAAIWIALFRIWLDIQKIGASLLSAWAQIWWSLFTSALKILWDLEGSIVLIFLNILKDILSVLSNLWTQVKGWAKEFALWFQAELVKWGEWLRQPFDKWITTIKTALSGIADAIASPFKDGGNRVMGVLAAILGGFNSLMAKFGIGAIKWDLPKFATGGVVPGTGNQDTTVALLTPGEVVVRRSAVARLGGPYAADAILNRGGLGLPRYGVGGVVGGIADAGSTLWAKALGIGGDILRFLTDPTGWLTDVINHSELGRMGGDIGDRLRDIPVGVMNAAVNKVKSLISEGAGRLGSLAGAVTGGVAHGAAAAVGAVSAAVGNDQLGRWIAAAIADTGVPEWWGPRLRVGIMRESGGNPNAVNRTDINAILGHPSIGLMQTIGPTFEAYRDPRLPDNIYDPVANIVAGIRYILARYGSILNVQQFNPNLPPRGYADGGIITTPQLAALHANEVVIPLSKPERAVQLANESGLLNLLAGAGGAGTVINAPITVNAPQSNPELVAWNVSAQIARLAAAGVG